MSGSEAEISGLESLLSSIIVSLQTGGSSYHIADTVSTGFGYLKRMGKMRRIELVRAQATACLPLLTETYTDSHAHRLLEELIMLLDHCFEGDRTPDEVIRFCKDSIQAMQNIPRSEDIVNCALSEVASYVAFVRAELENRSEHGFNFPQSLYQRRNLFANATDELKKLVDETIQRLMENTLKAFCNARGWFGEVEHLQSITVQLFSKIVYDSNDIYAAHRHHKDAIHLYTSVESAVKQRGHKKISYPQEKAQVVGVKRTSCDSNPDLSVYINCIQSLPASDLDSLPESDHRHLQSAFATWRDERRKRENGSQHAVMSLIKSTYRDLAEAEWDLETVYNNLSSATKVTISRVKCILAVVNKMKSRGGEIATKLKNLSIRELRINKNFKAAFSSPGEWEKIKLQHPNRIPTFRANVREYKATEDAYWMYISDLRNIFRLMERDLELNPHTPQEKHIFTLMVVSFYTSYYSSRASSVANLKLKWFTDKVSKDSPYGIVIDAPAYFVLSMENKKVARAPRMKGFPYLVRIFTKYYIQHIRPKDSPHEELFLRINGKPILNLSDYMKTGYFNHFDPTLVCKECPRYVELNTTRKAGTNDRRGNQISDDAARKTERALRASTAENSEMTENAHYITGSVPPRVAAGRAVVELWQELKNRYNFYLEAGKFHSGWMFLNYDAMQELEKDIESKEYLRRFQGE